METSQSPFRTSLFCLFTYRLDQEKIGENKMGKNKIIKKWYFLLFGWEEKRRRKKKSCKLFFDQMRRKVVKVAFDYKIIILSIFLYLFSSNFITIKVIFLQLHFLSFYFSSQSNNRKENIFFLYFLFPFIFISLIFSWHTNKALVIHDLPKSSYTRNVRILTIGHH